MIRVWNCLNKNRQMIASKKFSTQLVLRNELCSTEDLVRKCFAALKLTKETEKATLVTTELKDGENVAIE